MESSLPVVEKFHSIQGEGAHTGRSAFFIRLASCKVGCSWCDTKHSWQENLFPQEEIQYLSDEVAKAKSKGANFVVITGGEPLHHNLDPLCKAIRNITINHKGNAIPIHIETSGIEPISGSPNWITLSPKKHALPRIDILRKCQELKVIIHDQSDLIFAENMARKTRIFKKPILFLQPGWNNEKGKKLAFEYVRNNPQWRLSLQTHKWLDVL